MGVLFSCKRGYEKDLVDELAKFGIERSGLATATHEGWVHVERNSASLESISADDFTFAAQVSFFVIKLADLPEHDRVSPVIEALRRSYASYPGDPVYRELHVGHVADEGQAGLGKFCQKIQQVLASKLKTAGFKQVFSKAPAPNIHLLFHSFSHVMVGLGLPRQSSPFPWGVMRLKFPTGAPSRSTLKLEEAFLTLLTDEQRKNFVSEGMTAVDLGASPGGWTYQLVKRGMVVAAVDRGAIDPQLIATGMIDHVTDDAYTYVPRKPVDWMVCDVVEKPHRSAAMLRKWMDRRWCRFAIVNFKLPMNQRWKAVAEIDEMFADLPVCRIKQLYHDRAEVTAFVSWVNCS